MQFFGEFTVRETGYHTKSVNGATGYTLPKVLQQSLPLMTPQKQEISQQIISIPFPEIRNVIVTFLTPYPEIESDESDILGAEYRENKDLRRIDQEMVEKIRVGYHQRSKLQKVLKCFDKANGLKQKINELKGKIKAAKENNVTEKIQEIQQYARNKRSRVSLPQQKQQIQQEKNDAIIQNLLQHQAIYSSLNENFINLDATYSEVKEFCQEMQKIVPIVWRVEGISETREEIGSQNFIEYFKTTILEIFQPLSGFIHSSEALLQLFRSNVKSRSWSFEENSALILYQTKLQEFISKYSALQQTIKQKVYQKLKEISKLDQHIVRNLQQQITSNMKAYESFVETYTDIKEIANTKHQWDEFERIISDQERYLTEHMKLNCGLVVFYKPTKMFEDFANAIVKRTYVNQIFTKRLNPIRNALKYINEDYSGMYKRACEDNKSRSKLRKSDVKKVLDTLKEDFNSLDALQKYKNREGKNEKVYAEYVGHLIESLNRLMTLASQ